jgi:hypothetical protein
MSSQFYSEWRAIVFTPHQSPKPVSEIAKPPRIKRHMMQPVRRAARPVSDANGLYAHGAADVNPAYLPDWTASAGPARPKPPAAANPPLCCCRLHAKRDPTRRDTLTARGADSRSDGRQGRMQAAAASRRPPVGSTSLPRTLRLNSGNQNPTLASRITRHRSGDRYTICRDRGQAACPCRTDADRVPDQVRWRKRARKL